MHVNIILLKCFFVLYDFKRFLQWVVRDWTVEEKIDKNLSVEKTRLPNNFDLQGKKNLYRMLLHFSTIFNIYMYVYGVL